MSIVDIVIKLKVYKDIYKLLGTTYAIALKKS